MKFRRFDNFIWITCLVIVVTLGWSSTSVAQKSTDTISTVVIDSAPKKLYSELYSDETGNQFMVEIYEEPQEGENLIHFRSFKNGEIIGRKSQALADAHNFTFFIDETEQRIMRQDTEQMLYNVLKKLMEESDQKLKTNLEDLFDQEKMAQSLSEKIKIYRLWRLLEGGGYNGKTGCGDFVNNRKIVNCCSTFDSKRINFRKESDNS